MSLCKRPWVRLQRGTGPNRAMEVRAKSGQVKSGHLLSGPAFLSVPPSGTQIGGGTALGVQLPKVDVVSSLPIRRDVWALPALVGVRRAFWSASLAQTCSFVASFLAGSLPTWVAPVVLPHQC